MHFPSLLPFLVAGALGASAPPADAPASLDTFEREALATLKASQSERRGIYVHVGGQRIGGMVVAIGPDVVQLANREHGRILVRRDRIEAIEAP